MCICMRGGGGVVEVSIYVSVYVRLPLSHRSLWIAYFSTVCPLGEGPEDGNERFLRLSSLVYAGGCFTAGLCNQLCVCVTCDCLRVLVGIRSCALVLFVCGLCALCKSLVPVSLHHACAPASPSDFLHQRVGSHVILRSLRQI